MAKNSSLVDLRNSEKERFGCTGLMMSPKARIRHAGLDPASKTS
jgi:hypothetical protein